MWPRLARLSRRPDLGNEGLWKISTNKGDDIRAKYVVHSNGPLNRPKLPAIEGINDFKVYLFALFKAFIPQKKITNFDELERFIQSKSAWVSQVTLYGYLKTRMGTRYVLHFENDKFMASVNVAKWNIYSVALQDLTFFTLSYLKNFLHKSDLQ